MASFVWQRDPDEAYNNPYEYDAQAQFIREAKSVLDGLRVMLSEYDMKFYRNERSVKKAIWLLQTDALCSLREALVALEAQNHRHASRVFRDVVETLDLAKYFSSASDKSSAALEKWYNNDIISHSEYRKQVKKLHGNEIADSEGRQYRDLSKFTHRSYRAITASCGLGKDDLLWHENHSSEGYLVLPQPVAAYCAILASFIMTFCSEVASRGLLEPSKVKQLLSQSMEETPVERRLFTVKIVS
jgi:hypothetical protein